MALAVTHIILTIVLLDIFRHYVFGVHKFPRHLLVIGGIAGLLPDIDLVFTWVYNFFMGTQIDLHGAFTHSLIFPVILLGIAVFLHYQKQIKWAQIFYVIAAGWFLHLFLDCMFGGYKTFFWPFFSGFGSFCPQWGIDSYAAGIDAVILVLWLVHEEVHKKVKDYF